MEESNLEELIREELEEHERFCSKLPVYTEEVIRKKRIKAAEEEYDSLLKNDSKKYPVFGFNFREIRNYWKNLSDYEASDEYLKHAEGQYEYEKVKFIGLLMEIMDVGQYTVNPIPPEGTEEALRIHNAEIDMVTKRIGVDPVYRIKYPWMTYNKDTGQWRFSREKIDRFFKVMFELERQEIEYLRDRGDISRRDKQSKKGETDHSAKKSKSGKTTWYLNKFICPENKIKNIDKAFQVLSCEATLTLPENFKILNYFSTKPEKKEKKKLSEQIIDWVVPDDLAGFVAFIEILEEDYRIETMPSMVRATFKREGDDIGAYGTYKSSKEATNSYDKRKKIDERKSQLKKLLGLN